MNKFTEFSEKQLRQLENVRFTGSEGSIQFFTFGKEKMGLGFIDNDKWQGDPNK